MSKTQAAIAEKLQEECHQYVQAAMANNTFFKKISYQDATNVWIFNKLAELQCKITALEDKDLDFGI